MKLTKKDKRSILLNASKEFNTEVLKGSRLLNESIKELIVPGGRLRDQRDLAWKLINEIPGISCVKPKGAMYLFCKMDPAVHKIKDDEKMVLDLLLQEKILIVQGTAFNWPDTDHFRIVFLSREDELRDAIARIKHFFSTYSQ